MYYTMLYIHTIYNVNPLPPFPTHHTAHTNHLQPHRSPPHTPPPKVSTRPIPRPIPRPAPINTRNPTPHQIRWHQRLHLLQPNRLIQPRAPIGGNTPRLQTPPLLLIGTARAIGSPERPRSPRSPANVLLVISHVVEDISDVTRALRAVGGPELGDHGFETVFFEPGGEGGEGVGGEVLAGGVGPGEVGVDVLVDVEGEVGGGVAELVHHLAGGGGVAVVVFGPGVPAGPAVAGGDDAVGVSGRLGGGKGGAYSCNAPVARMASTAAWSLARTRLVSMSWGFGVLASLSRCREKIDWDEITYLVHKPEDNLLVVHEAASKLAPEFTKLLSGCRRRVRGVTDNTPGHGLLRRVVVSHVIVGV